MAPGQTPPSLHSQLKALQKSQQQQWQRVFAHVDDDALLLDGLRDYMRKRIELETDYARGLEKLARQMAATTETRRKTMGTAIVRKKQTENDSSNAGNDDAVSIASGVTSNIAATINVSTTSRSGVAAAESGRFLLASWQTLVSETERQARYRVMLTEKWQQQLLDPVKEYAKEKSTQSKKYQDFLVKSIEDLSVQYQELDKTRKVYEEAAKESALAQSRYDEALRKPKTALTTISSVVSGGDGGAAARVEKLRSKWKQAEVKTAEARNDYILARIAANTTQQRYYEQELPEILKMMDGSFYDTTQGHFHLWVQLEADRVEFERLSNDTLKNFTEKISRASEWTGFMKEHGAIFSVPSPHPFDALDENAPAQDDIVNNEGTSFPLSTRLSALQTRQGDAKTAVQVLEKEMAALQHLMQVYEKTPSFGDVTQPRLQLADLQLSKIHADTELMRIDQQIERLLRAGVIVQVVAEVRVQPRGSIAVGSSDRLATRTVTVTSLAPAALAASGQVLRSHGTALYNYQGQDETELSIQQGDAVVIIGPDAEAEGWIQAEVHGLKGRLPASYVEVSSSTPTSSHLSRSTSIMSSNTTLNKSLSTSTPMNKLAAGVSSNKQQTAIALYDFDGSNSEALSFHAGDVLVILEKSDPDWWTGRLTSTGQEGAIPANYVELQQQQSQTLLTSRSPSKQQIAQQSTQVAPVGQVTKVTQQSTPPRQQQKVKALYSYEATCDGELSFNEGDIITVTNKQIGSDTWWEGEIDGRVGQFPKDYVELISTAKKHLVRAIYDYDAQLPTELSMTVNEQIEVLKENLDGDEEHAWYFGRSMRTGREGEFPRSYVTDA